MSTKSYFHNSYRAMLTAISLAVFSPLASADFCDLLAGKSAPNCRSNAKAMNATIIGNWLRIKPEYASQPNTGKKGKFSSATTVSYSLIGVTSPDKFKLSVDCFSGEKSMRLQAITHMIGHTQGKNIAFNLSFSVDNKPGFTEKWIFNWKRSELEAPKESRLARELVGAHDLTITADNIVDNRYSVGYVFKVDGYESMSAALCK